MAKQNFCTNCGSPLEHGARFCTSCGQPVDAMGPEDETKLMPTTVPAEEAVVSPRPSETSGFMPIASPHPKANESPYAAAVEHKDHRETLIMALVGVLVALVVGILLYVFVFSQAGKATGGPLVQQEQTSQDQGSRAEGKPQAEADASKDAGKADAAGTQAAADEKFHSAVVEYYGRLSSFDERIREQASNFNASFLDGSIGTRTDYAFACSTLMGEVQEQLRGLSSLSVPSDSKWAEQYELVKRCYADHLARISCINDAWQIDIQYGDPTGHKDEILMPIAAQNGSDGSIPFADYESVYPTISL